MDNVLYKCQEINKISTSQYIYLYPKLHKEWIHFISTVVCRSCNHFTGHQLWDSDNNLILETRKHILFLRLQILNIITPDTQAG